MSGTMQMGHGGVTYTDNSSGGWRKPSPGKAIAVGVVTAIILVLLGGLLIGSCQSLDSTDAGQVAVVLNGGPFDSKDQRETVPPSSGWMVPGLASAWHKYYSDTQQRYFRISAADSDDPATTSVSVPTKDGVLVSIEALTNFHTVFTGTDDDPALKEFDLKFGQRGFGADDEHVYEDAGWGEFLKAQIGPVIVSTFREEIGQLDCEELVSSCALIQQNRDAAVPVDGQAAEGSLSKVEQAVQAKLQTRIDTALGGSYLTGWQVNIEKVNLPGDVQEKINSAQAAFAQISEQRANAQAARYEAQRTKVLARQYANNPEYAQIKAVEECASASGCQVILGDVPGINVGR